MENLTVGTTDLAERASVLREEAQQLQKRAVMLALRSALIKERSMEVMPALFPKFHANSTHTVYRQVVGEFCVLMGVPTPDYLPAADQLRRVRLIRQYSGELRAACERTRARCNEQRYALAERVKRSRILLESARAQMDQSRVLLVATAPGAF